MSNKTDKVRKRNRKKGELPPKNIKNIRKVRRRGSNLQEGVPQQRHVQRPEAARDQIRDHLAVGGDSLGGTERAPPAPAPALPLVFAKEGQELPQGLVGWIYVCVFSWE